MTAADLQRRFQAVCTQTRCDQPLPLPAQGNTPERHRHLFDIALEDLSLAKLAEAHWDALAILAEAGRTPKPGALYAVWASEIPDQPLQLTNNRLSGTKAFCTGYGLVDRALVTLGTGDRRIAVANRGVPQYQHRRRKLPQSPGRHRRSRRQHRLLPEPPRLLARRLRTRGMLGRRRRGPARLRGQQQTQRPTHAGPPRGHALQRMGNAFHPGHSRPRNRRRTTRCMRRPGARTQSKTPHRAARHRHPAPLRTRLRPLPAGNEPRHRPSLSRTGHLPAPIPRRTRSGSTRPLARASTSISRVCHPVA